MVICYEGEWNIVHCCKYIFTVVIVVWKGGWWSCECTEGMPGRRGCLLFVGDEFCGGGFTLCVSREREKLLKSRHGQFQCHVKCHGRFNLGNIKLFQARGTLLFLFERVYLDFKTDAKLQREACHHYTH